MKKVITLSVLTLLAVTLISGKKDDGTMTKENGFYVVNTTKLGKNVMGYEGPTPLKVYIKKGRVDHIEALPNQETPRYWLAAWKQLAEAWNGHGVKEAREMKVDGRTGATFSSDAVKENVRLALEYYEKNK